MPKQPDPIVTTVAPPSRVSAANQAAQEGERAKRRRQVIANGVKLDTGAGDTSTPQVLGVTLGV